MSEDKPGTIESQLRDEAAERKSWPAWKKITRGLDANGTPLATTSTAHGAKFPGRVVLHPDIEAALRAYGRAEYDYGASTPESAENAADKAEAARDAFDRVLLRFLPAQSRLEPVPAREEIDPDLASKRSGWFFLRRRQGVRRRRASSQSWRLRPLPVGAAAL